MRDDAIYNREKRRRKCDEIFSSRTRRKRVEVICRRACEEEEEEKNKNRVEREDETRIVRVHWPYGRRSSSQSSCTCVRRTAFCRGVLTLTAAAAAACCRYRRRRRAHCLATTSSPCCSYSSSTAVSFTTTSPPSPRPTVRRPGAHARGEHRARFRVAAAAAAAK